MNKRVFVLFIQYMVLLYGCACGEKVVEYFAVDLRKHEIGLLMKIVDGNNERSGSLVFHGNDESVAITRFDGIRMREDLCDISNFIVHFASEGKYLLSIQIHNDENVKPICMIESQDLLEILSFIKSWKCKDRLCMPEN